jgi:hypothetical protein
MDGGRWRWAWVSGSTTPRLPPTAPYPLAPGVGSGRCLPYFLLMGLRAEFLAKIKKLLFLCFAF